ncbi:MAG TPA: SRPBCC family protein [Thermoanaerobaculia bacterium]|nr:SRPBCC family protein [Thermoanaerobaculia bacterium]
MPHAGFEHHAAAPAPPDRAWAALQDAATWDGLGPIAGVWDAAHGEDGGLRSFRFRAAVAGRSFEGTARAAATRPGEEMTLRLDTGEVRAVLTAALSAAGDGTGVAVRLDVEPAGMLATLFWRVVRDAVASEFAPQVEALASRLGGP